MANNFTCDKCKILVKEYHPTLFYVGGKNYEFCALCSAILEKNERTGMLSIFLDEDAVDYDEIIMSEEERNMLRARQRRSKGKSIWS